jgi:hypothetical protein
MEKEKIFGVVITDKEKLKEEFQTALKNIQKIAPKIDEICKTMNALNPQQKLFFIDLFLKNFIVNSELPEFYMTALLNEMIGFIGKEDKEKIEEFKEDKKYTGYFG